MLLFDRLTVNPMLDQHLYWLNHIKPDLRSSVGDKAFYLGLASQRGYPVISGFVLSADVFKEFLARIQWLEPFLADLPNSSLHLNVNRPQQLQAIAQQIQWAIQTTPFPPEWAVILEDACHTLPSRYVICRPSVSVKGRHNSTLSLRIRGLLSSYVCRTDSIAITQAIQQVWAEIFCARSLFVWQRAGIQLQHIQVGVLIQPMYSPIASGILQQCTNGVEIHACWGLGLAIKTGDVIPDQYLIDATSGSINVRKLGRKPYAYSLVGGIPPDLGSSSDIDIAVSGVATQFSNLQLYAVDLARQDEAALPEASLREFAQLSESLTAEFGTTVSLEWAIGDAPFPTESRPLRYGLLEADQKWLYLTQVLPQSTVLPSRLTPSPVTREFTSENVTGPAQATQRYGIQQQSVREQLPSIQPPSRQMIGSSQDSPPLRYGDPSELSVVTPVTTALGASPGQVVGPAWVVSDTLEQSITHLPTGYILVASDITPDWLLDIKRAVALVSERGGMTCHAAIVARELGIPAVVGVRDVAQLFKTGDTLLVNGDRGTIHRVEAPHRAESAHLRATGRSPTVTSENDTDDPVSSPATGDSGEINPSQPVDPLIQTADDPFSRLTVDRHPHATQLMVSISQPERLADLKRLPIDGIGLLRGEFLLPSVLGNQSLDIWMRSENEQCFVDQLSTHLRLFLEAVDPAPVYYRTFDLRAHEFAALLGDRSQSTPPVSEPNPLLGLHGTLSYIQNPSLFQLELRALHQLRQAGYGNLHLILPFVRTVEEFVTCRQWILQAGLLQFSDFQVWIMAEVPSVLFVLPDYVNAGVSGIAIGTNDLTQFMLAIDRNHPSISAVFNQRHPSVIRAMHHLVKAARELTLPCSICGEIPNQYPDLVKQFVEWGVTSVVVSPSAVERTYQAIAQDEEDLN